MNKSKVGGKKIVNYDELVLTTLPTNENGESLSDRHLIIHLIHNRKDIKVGDTISVEDNFGDLYDYKVLEIGNLYLMVFEL